MALEYGFALAPIDDSTAFSNAMQAAFGDGIALEGGRFGLTINGFTAALASGYALVEGRWIQGDEPMAIKIGPSGNNNDRTDALVAQVDYEARKVALEVLADVDPNNLRAGGGIVLYLIHVRRGVTALTPDDVADLRKDGALCGQLVPLSSISEKALYIYNFLLSGIDEEIARIIGMSDKVAQHADEEIKRLDEAIQKAGGTASIGELLTSRREPRPLGEWLLCDGGAVPTEYPTLSDVLGGTLPNIPGKRYKTYIYGGTPVEA